MDTVTLSQKVTAFFTKYKYAILVLLLGLVLMGIPNRKTTPPPAPPETSQTPQAVSMDERLIKILSKIDGAGKVEVLLSCASGEEILYQENIKNAHSDTSDTDDRTTVTVTDSQRAQNGLIKQINPPTYLGAIVICQGADSPAVRLAITQAVAKITGLGADRISVLKMK